MTDDPLTPQKDNRPSGWKAAAAIFVRMLYGLLAAAIMVAIVKVARDGHGFLATIDSAKIYDQHGPAALGIPVAGISALLLISLARAFDGSMSLDLFGFKSEGASATCIVWAILFLVIGLSFRALW